MRFITDLGLSTMISLGVVCLIITITFTVLAYTTPSNTDTGQMYDNISGFSLLIVLPVGLGFFLLAFMYWTYVKQSAQNIKGAAGKHPGPKVPKAHGSGLKKH
jgi:multisubunit Na+/H+ antiporter MnhB subunit